MEDPSTWAEAERVVAAALDRYEDALRTHPDACKLSAVRFVTDSLRNARMLVDDA